MESMYFGDEDPMLVMSDQILSTNLPSKDRPQDLVLLFDDSANSFTYSDGGGAADISSSVILSPTAGIPQCHAAEGKV